MSLLPDGSAVFTQSDDAVHVKSQVAAAPPVAATNLPGKQLAAAAGAAHKAGEAASGATILEHEPMTGAGEPVDVGSLSPLNHELQLTVGQ